MPGLPRIKQKPHSLCSIHRLTSATSLHRPTNWRVFSSINLPKGSVSERRRSARGTRPTNPAEIGNFAIASE